jgi:hypothetical protein
MHVAGNSIDSFIVSRTGKELAEAVLTAHPTWFTVRYSLSVVDPHATVPQFFYDGAHGFDLAGVNGGFNPSAPATAGLPRLATAGRLPLAPAPLQVQMHTASGWLGVGLAEVPNATELRIDPRGAVDVDYPLQLLRSVPDTGSGGMNAGALRFPTFIVTLAPDTSAGLSEYHRAVVAAGDAPTAAPQQASWWHQPIVDTWGAQMAAHAIRGSPDFTTAWVRNFVSQEEKLYGLDKFTLVIDSRWQQELGYADPDSVRFGGAAGMRALIDDLHAMGLRVLLWWPIWSTGTVESAVPSPHGTADIDPTAPGFADRMAATVTEMLGVGPGDLAADGLKIDWEYHIPQQVADPALGYGDAALYRYFQVIHSAARAVRTDALVEASAASPQFERVTDSVRLYDAWSEKSWDERAAIVAAAEPGVLIDGDGWDATPANAVAHAISSTVYGVPALYFGGTWGNGTPVADVTARLLGTVAGLAADKGAGQVVALPGSGWELVSRGREVAQTLNGETGVVVWSPGAGQTMLGRVVTTVGGRVLIPMPKNGSVSVVAPSGASVPVTTKGNRIQAQLQPHDVYTIIVR